MYARRDDAGFTLIELIIAIVILGIIIVPLTGAIIDGLTTTTNAQSRLSESRSPMFTSVWFADDAQSADSYSIPPSGPSCGGGTNVVSFTWTENSTLYRASYSIAVAGAKKTLTRTFCSPNSSPQVVTVAPVLGANLGCGQPACASVTPDSSNPVRAAAFTLTATTPNNENYFTLSATRRAT
jgi:prepilin-type N-terminal cleavage/methylation domain-containing protein